MNILKVVAVILCVGGVISGCWRDDNYDHRGHWDDHRGEHFEHRDHR